MGNTLIRSFRWRSDGEHSDPELAVEVRRGAEEGGGGQADIKSNHPHRTGGEISWNSTSYSLPIHQETRKNWCSMKVDGLISEFRTKSLCLLFHSFTV